MEEVYREKFRLYLVIIPYKGLDFWAAVPGPGIQKIPRMNAVQMTPRLMPSLVAACATSNLAMNLLNEVKQGTSITELIPPLPGRGGHYLSR
jgi:hypothetical protein